MRCRFHHGDSLVGAASEQVYTGLEPFVRLPQHLLARRLHEAVECHPYHSDHCDGPHIRAYGSGNAATPVGIDALILLGGRVVTVEDFHARNVMVDMTDSPKL